MSKNAYNHYRQYISSAGESVCFCLKKKLSIVVHVQDNPITQAFYRMYRIIIFIMISPSVGSVMLAVVIVQYNISAV